MNKKRLLTIVSVLLILCICSSVSAFAEDYDEYRIYYDGSNTKQVGYYIKGNVYLPISLIGKYCENNGIAVDTKAMQLNINLATQNIIMADDTTTNFIKQNAGTVYVPLKDINGTICFSANTMGQFYKLAYSVSSDKIYLHEYTGSEKFARINSNNVDAVASLSNDNDNDRQFTAGERVFIDKETRSLYKVKDLGGNMYYIPKTSITIENIDLSTIDFYAPQKTKYIQDKNQKINVVWQYVSHITPDAPTATKGIDIMAPTWFRLAVNEGGSVINNADKGYTELCHQNGFKVWSTITNNMSVTGSTKFTTQMFTTPSIQKKAIAQYVFYACLYDVDGINIDFEDVSDSDADGLTAFTAEMRYYTERQGLNLSIDTLIPAAWTIEYDRDALAEHVDYLAVMTYDQHYSGSKTPGSVSEVSWAEKAVKACLDEGVPTSKLLMGVPLYTRVWVVDSNGTLVSNSSATMQFMKNKIAEKNLTPTYIESAGQNYVEYASESGTAKVWIEDETSIKNRLDLVNQYDLAGSACWQYAQGSNDIWSVFYRNLQ